MSHGAWFRKRSDLVEAIEAAMDEAMDQGASLALPTVREGNPVTLQQARLMTVAGRRSVASVPLLDRGLPVGVLTLERGIDEEEFDRSEEHTSELQSLMRISYAVFCSKKKTSQILNT